MEDKERLCYRNKIILAPMVKINTLPMRLLALDYGAEIVYTEELIDYKLLNCHRKVNETLNSIDFIDKSDGTVVFRTCPQEKPYVVLQIGTNDPNRAAMVAKLVQHDVAGIDINMGCPKNFSLKGGMGAALLKFPDKACAILSTVISAVKIPVTCKIRILHNVNETVNFCKKLEATGIAAISIHGRRVYERPYHENKNDVIKAVSEALEIPVIANGGSKDIKIFEDFEKFKIATGCNSLMIARSAEKNCSIFKKDGKLEIPRVIQDYLRHAINYDNFFANTKYCIQNMMGNVHETQQGRAFLETTTLYEISELWELGDYCRETQKKMNMLRFEERDLACNDQKRLKLNPIIEVQDDVNSLKCMYIRSLYLLPEDLPKTKLLNWAKLHRKPLPKYHTEQFEKLFKSTVTFDNKKYSSSFWEKSKRCAEQGSAIVCLHFLKVYDVNYLKINGILG
ncbi:tRNA-dihydrouridine(20) synthase [NAD(P)+]-like isoform X2 [Daktulosphaira vitifoliae]|uniref:tRNA-dihydrouridine(20) synthase [NAD(P)+]-like isoform X2 n=1 Tax=Daktulosphaira vitifoliae TaxID=58002 RepID=UPI0021AA8771|nr:tRNA-dihydrouridine(20) synthase [NAD(P)+]-like isoform X2 [Daktulosphaira vitifoliae]